MDTRRKNQLFFYLDIVILGLGAVALVALVHDAFYAGFAAESEQALVQDYVARLVAEAGTVAVALVYFLTRFFRARVRELANPWG